MALPEKPPQTAVETWGNRSCRDQSRPKRFFYVHPLVRFTIPFPLRLSSGRTEFCIANDLFRLNEVFRFHWFMWKGNLPIGVSSWGSTQGDFCQ